MSEADILKAGISAYQAGDHAKATALFAQVVKQNPLSEQGWYLLGMSVDSREQREYCLKRVLTINPNNQQSRRQLTIQTAPVPVPPPAAVSTPTPRPQQPSQPQKPFIAETDAPRPSVPTFEADQFRDSTSTLDAAKKPQ